MNTDSLRYAGFWPRLGSLLLDMIILLPVASLVLWGSSYSRLFRIYYLLPDALIWVFFGVYLVRRFWGTPGKLIVGIRIRKVNGESVGWREAWLRFLPDFVLSLLFSLALIVPLLHMSDAEYHSLSYSELNKHLAMQAPIWFKPVQWTQSVWTWSELIVLLTNHKRRALHDFIAGTVVVYKSSETLPEPLTVATPSVSTGV